MTRSLSDWVDDLPSLSLGHLPTPLEEAPRLSQRLGVDLLIKREDLAGGAFGGNKIRKLALLAAGAEAAAADVWLCMGGPQSNYVRETAAVGARLGKRTIGFLRGSAPARRGGGNLLVDGLLGAELRYVPGDDYDAVWAAMQDECARQSAAGRCAHAFPLGGADPLGVAGWHRGAAELASQVEAHGRRLDAVVLAAGTGSTALGLALGLADAEAAAGTWGISVSWPAATLAGEAARLTAATHAAAGLPTTAAGAGAVPPALRWDDREIGAGYTQPTATGRRALRLLAREHGLIADLTYSAKGFAGLCRLVAEERIPRGATVVFVHTGGAPELFARARTAVLASRTSPSRKRRAPDEA